jgi:hypothetical protein
MTPKELSYQFEEMSERAIKELVEYTGLHFTDDMYKTDPDAIVFEVHKLGYTICEVQPYQYSSTIKTMFELRLDRKFVARREVCMDICVKGEKIHWLTPKELHGYGEIRGKCK